VLVVLLQRDDALRSGVPGLTHARVRHSAASGWTDPHAAPGGEVHA
jgi:hypothetical protein